MKKLFFALLALAVLCSCGNSGVRSGSGSGADGRSRAIDAELLAVLEQNAYQSEDNPFFTASIKDVVRDPSVTLDTTTTYRVRTYGVTDQMKSGRCWLFSTLNILRAESGLGDFQFSQTYGQFYDVLEKSNRCLENIIDHAGEPMDSRYNEWIFKKPIADGGQFMNAAHLIEKYGVVPLEVMPERFSSTTNLILMNTVRELLRKYGLELRRVAASAPAKLRAEAAAGFSGKDAALRSEALQAVKTQALADIYRVLTATLGVPPQTFEWRGRTWTPQSFKQEFVHHDMEADYVVFMNDPTRPYYRTYTVENTRNCYEYADWTFLNVPMADIDSMALASLKGGVAFYVSADTEHDNLDPEGIYDMRSFARKDSLLGINSAMTKAEQLESCESRSVHAIAVVGVRLDGAGKPESWLVENSFGLSRGADGYVTFSPEWLDRYLYRLVVERRFVPDSLLELTGGKPSVIPAWNPVY